MVGGGAAPVTRWKDGREWRIGSDADVAWIREGTALGLSITSAVPPVFASYATVLVPNKDEGRAEDLDVLLRLLGEQSPDQPWWLGYLETGADDVVFASAGVAWTSTYRQPAYSVTRGASVKTTSSAPVSR